MVYPKISIVTPTLNQAKFLEQTILSITNQNYPNLEYILIDGGSTDGSVEIIKKYADKLAYWVSEPDKGMYDAIQKGFDKSTGDIMAWLNSDDIYYPNAFLNVAKIFQTFPNVKWLTGLPTHINEEGSVISLNYIPRWSKYRYFNKKNESYIQQESTFWHRQLWNKVGAKLNTDLRYAGDYDLWLQFFKYEKLYYVPTLIGGFRERSTTQLSSDYYHLYIAEATASRRKIRQTLRFVEKIKTSIINVDRFLSAIPNINKIYDSTKIAQTIFDYPCKLIFDKSKQTFILK